MLTNFDLKNQNVELNTKMLTSFDLINENFDLKSKKIDKFWQISTLIKT